MPTRTRRGRGTRSSPKRQSSSVSRYNSMISAKLDDIEASVQRIRRGASRRGPTLAKARKKRLDTTAIKSSLQGTNFQELLEKAADVTGRWQRTAGMMGIIGNNVKGMAGPVLNGIKNASPLARVASSLGGLTRGRGPGMAAAGSAVGNAASNGLGGMDFNGMVQTVLSNLSGGGGQGAGANE